VVGTAGGSVNKAPQVTHGQTGAKLSMFDIGRGRDGDGNGMHGSSRRVTDEYRCSKNGPDRTPVTGTSEANTEHEFPSPTRAVLPLACVRLRVLEQLESAL